MVGMTEDERDDMLAVVDTVEFVTFVVWMDAVAPIVILTGTMEEVDIGGIVGERE
jgi:hypothetical protein